MKRREFALASALLAVGGALALPAHAQNRAKDGYVRLNAPAPSDAADGQIEVLEFFSYGCIHCMNFDPLFEEWRKKQPADVLVTRVHVGFSKSFEPMQKIFYALQAIDAGEQVHAKAFDAILTKRQRLSKESVLFPWVEQQGVDRAKFEQAYKSFGVASKVRRANELVEAYRVEGTPALGIAGRYYTDGSMAHGFGRMLQLADELVAKERDALKAAQKKAA